MKKKLQIEDYQIRKIKNLMNFKNFTNLESRSGAERSEAETLTYRTIPIGARADGAPASLDEKTRSIEVVGATENPVEVWDWERFEIVREVCLMSGCMLPANRQTVLLDSHQRYGTGSVVGSYRDMRIEGLQMVGRAYFTSLPEGDAPYIKVKEGHVTDFSVGYRVLESEWVKAGETSMIQGRKFEGPLRVTTKWVPREMSVCPLGADEMAKVRTIEDSRLKIENSKTKKENKKEEQTMNKKLRELLIKRGLPVEATEDEAWEFLVKLGGAAERTGNEAGTGHDFASQNHQKPAPTGAKTEIPDTETITREAEDRELARVVEIGAMCKRFDITEEERDKLINDKIKVDAARKTVMDLVEKRQKENPQRLPTYPVIEGVADEGDKFRAAACDSLILRAGIAQIKIEKPAPGAQELRGYTLREMARLCLQRKGERVPWDVMEMIGRAMVVGDFPILLAATANKSLFAGYESAPETWPIWCATGSVSDFKTQTSARVSETDDLDLIPDHGEYKYGDLAEAQEQYAIATYGKLFAITRHTIINDDLNALSNIPAKHGEAWARKIGDLAYAILNANPNMGDGVALFTLATHGNVGTAGTISEVTIAELIKLMKLQKGLKDKQHLNIRGEYIIAPVAIEGTTEIFFNSGNFSKTNEAATRNNPYAGTRFTRVYDARLDGTSATCWYMAGPKGKTVVIFFLNGVQTPFLDTKDGWSVDGVEFKVRGDAGAKAMDWKALASNDGA